MSPVQLAPCIGCSRHDCAAASGQLLSHQLGTKLHCKLQMLAFGLPMTLSAQRHGDFPRSMSGASSLYVGCVAVLPLPPLVRLHRVMRMMPLCCAAAIYHSMCSFVALNRNCTS